MKRAAPTTRQPPTPPVRVPLWPGRERARILLALGWYSAAMHQGVAAYGRQAGWIMDLHALRTGRVLEPVQCDGMICGLGVNSPALRHLRPGRIPTVIFGYGNPGSTLPRVVHDNVAIGRLAASHLLERGHRHFAIYRRDVSSGSGERLEIFAQAVAAAGMPCHRLDYVAARRRARRYLDPIAWLAAELARLPTPLALMADFDDSAIEAIDACQVAGLLVPEHVAIVGADNDELRCDNAAVPLTSVDSNMYGLGYAAAEVLDRLMRGRALPPLPVRVMPKGVVMRQSTNSLAIPHLHVATTLRRLMEHYTEPVRAQDIMRTVPMSARRLHDAFVRHVGRTVAAQLTHLRLEQAQRLLRETPQKVAAIATACGWTSADRMARIFRRELGLSPATYRRRERQMTPPSQGGRQ